MNVSVAGPTIVTSRAKEALAFYATHFDLVANDYGAGDDCWYWTLTFREHSELSFMTPQGGEADFTGQGMFFYVELPDGAAVDALYRRMDAAGLEASAPMLEDGMYQYWVTDPAGLRLMVHATVPA